MYLSWRDQACNPCCPAEKKQKKFVFLDKHVRRNDQKKNRLFIKTTYNDEN